MFDKKSYEHYRTQIFTCNINNVAHLNYNRTDQDKVQALLKQNDVIHYLILTDNALYLEILTRTSTTV